MARWGIGLLIMGIGAFILPMMGMQFRLLQIFGEYDWAAGATLAAIGVVLLTVSAISGGNSQSQG